MTGIKLEVTSALHMNTQQENSGVQSEPLNSDTSTSDSLSYQSNLDEDNVNTTITANITEVSSGPLPNPRYLEKYNEIIPNGGERIMKMAEKEQDFRHSERRKAQEIEHEKISKQLKYLYRGQNMAFIIVLMILSLATVFVFTAHEGMAYTLYGISMVSLVGMFLGIKIKGHQ